MKFILFFLIPLTLTAHEIKLFHHLDGKLETTFNEIVADFNKKSEEKVIIINGPLDEISPNIVQFDALSTQDLLEIEMHKLYRELPDTQFLEIIKHTLESPYKKLYCFPCVVTTQVMFYNKSLIQEAPRTWNEFETSDLKIVYPKEFIEETCGRHNSAFASQHNGFDGISGRLVFDKPQTTSHLTKVINWHNQGVLTFDKEDFISGKSALYIADSTFLTEKTPFEIGVSPVPYWQEFVDAPYNSTIKTSSFWVIDDQQGEISSAIASFFKHLNSPLVQAYWHQKTGCLPLNQKAYDLSKKSGFYQLNPGFQLSVEEVVSRPFGAYSWGTRLPKKIQFIINEQIAKAIKGEQTAEVALQAAVTQGNQFLDECEKEFYERNF